MNNGGELINDYDKDLTGPQSFSKLEKETTPHNKPQTLNFFLFCSEIFLIIVCLKEKKGQ